jgi:thiosulfate/3-mercaptopyruvate sulfurtransferase
MAMQSFAPPIVDLNWVRERLDGVVFADVRWYLDGRSGRDAYDSGHLPGAVFVDLDAVLAAPPSPIAGRHPLPDPEVFAAEMATLGIGDEDIVVAYDDAGGVFAARLVWMLRAGGHSAALLDGGLAAWAGPLETTPQARPPAQFASRPWPDERLASPDDASDPTNVVLDARDGARYRGEVESVDPRAGHIPGARSFPCRENLGDDGLLLGAAELRGRLAELEVGPDTPLVSYCGSGVTACHNLLVLEHLGLGHGRLYPGSWSQWAADPSRPVARGD